ncbi:GumC family protein [Tunicatimonas pelagia]|uniref:GumC family protein n=1 Tax=Tunicatimonas pelagia TaxID=931531 RepID=UPI002666C75F|nr:polysaccharide biosynthesis tyrosine autokinase [Tunicatimonas pelagia]WKN41964.1 polysaccharide biosynthesis tyrosine autokinase [Tunicatimonas pelagia]
MNTEPTYVENTINFTLLFSQIRKKWYLFLICFLIIIPVALLFVKFGEKKYDAYGSVLISKQEFGSVGTDQVLVDDNRIIERSIILQDEIKRLNSFDLIHEALNTLDFGITYYTVESFWPDFLKESWLNETYHALPIDVVLDSSQVQLVGALVHLSIDESNNVTVRVDAEKSSIHNLATNQKVAEVEAVSFEETTKIGEPFSNEYLAMQIVPTSEVQPVGDYYFKISTSTSLANKYQDLLVAQPASTAAKAAPVESRVVNLSIETPIPEKGVTFLNALINTYISKDVQNKNQKGVTTVAFLEKEIAIIGDSLKKARSSFGEFRNKNNIVDLAQGKLLGLNKQNELEVEQSELENRLAYYKRTSRSLRNEGSLVTPSAAGISDRAFEELVMEHIALNARAKRALNYNNADNPLVNQIEQQLTILKGAISDNLDNAITTTQTNLRSVNRRLGQINSQVKALPDNEQEFDKLDRDVAYYQEKYDYLIRKKADSELALATNLPDVEIVDSVKISPEPVAPNGKLILMSALFLSLVLPFGFIVPSMFFGDNLVNKSDIEDHAEIPMLGVVSNGPKAGGLVAKSMPNTSVAESFEYIRINLQYYFRERNNQVIGITSSVEGEGKTFCATNLAWTFAEAGQKTLLIGCDFRRPKVDKYFKNDTLYGLANYLEKGFEIEKLFRPSSSPNLDIIFSGFSNESPIKLLEKPSLRELIERVKSEYDQIIVDTPPVGLVADYLILEQFFDLTLFVVRNNYTDRATIKGINEIQRKNQIKNLNLVLNGASSSGYGYVQSKSSYYRESASLKSRFKLS